MWKGLLTDRVNNNLEKSYLINDHALNRHGEPVPLTASPLKYLETNISNTTEQD